MKSSKEFFNPNENHRKAYENRRSVKGFLSISGRSSRDNKCAAGLQWSYDYSRVFCILKNFIRSSKEFFDPKENHRRAFKNRRSVEGRLKVFYLQTTCLCFLSKSFRSSFFSRATFGKPFEGSKANDGTD